MTRRRPSTTATTAAHLSPGDTFTVRLSAAIRREGDGWICRLATDSCGVGPVVWVPERAEVTEVVRYQPASVASGEVADPLAEVRR